MNVIEYNFFSLMLWPFRKKNADATTENQVTTVGAKKIRPIVLLLYLVSTFLSACTMESDFRPVYKGIT